MRHPHYEMLNSGQESMASCYALKPGGRSSGMQAEQAVDLSDHEGSPKSTRQ